MNDKYSRGVSRAGFSLVELLAVIGILAVLACIVIPVVSRINASARSSQCVSNLRQLHAATQLMILDSNYQMPDRRYWSYDKAPSSSAYAYQLASYLGLDEAKSDSDLYTEPTVMTCTSAHLIVPSTQAWRRTYSINTHACSTSDGAALSELWYPRQMMQIEHPSKMALFMDGAVNPAGNGTYWSNANSTQIAGGSAPILYAHGGAINVVFIDGNVQQFTQDEMERDYSDPYATAFWRFNGTP